MNLNIARRQLNAEQRRDVVLKLRQRQWSAPRIAEKLGVGVGTVHRDMDSGFPSGKPESESDEDDLVCARCGGDAEQIEQHGDIWECDNCKAFIPDGNLGVLLVQRAEYVPRSIGKDGKSYPARPCSRARMAGTSIEAARSSIAAKMPLRTASAKSGES